MASGGGTGGGIEAARAFIKITTQGVKEADKALDGVVQRLRQLSVQLKNLSGVTRVTGRDMARVFGGVDAVLATLTARMRAAVTQFRSLHASLGQAASVAAFAPRPPRPPQPPPPPTRPPRTPPAGFADALSGAGTAVSQFAIRLQVIGSQLKSLSSQLSIFSGAVIFTVSRSVSEFAKLQSVLRTFDIVFSEQAREAREFGEAFADAIGAPRSAILGGLTTFQAIFRNQGFDSGASSRLTQQVVALSQDVAAAFGLGAEEAVARFVSALEGEAEALDRFGFNLREAALNQALLARGFKTVAQGASESEKQLARIDIIFKSLSTTGLLGRARADANTLAGAIRRAGTALEEFRLALGEAFGRIAVGVLRSVTSFFNNLAAGLRRLQPEQVERLATQLGKLAALGPTLGIVGTLLTLLGTAITGLQIAVTGLANPLTRLPTLLVIGPAIAAAINGFQELRDAVVQTARDIGTSLGTFSELLASGASEQAIEAFFLAQRLAVLRGQRALKADVLEGAERVALEANFSPLRAEQGVLLAIPTQQRTEAQAKRLKEIEEFFAARIAAISTEFVRFSEDEEIQSIENRLDALRNEARRSRETRDRQRAAQAARSRVPGGREQPPAGPEPSAAAQAEATRAATAIRVRLGLENQLAALESERRQALLGGETLSSITAEGRAREGIIATLSAELELLRTREELLERQRQEVKTFQDDIAPNLLDLQAAQQFRALRRVQEEEQRQLRETQAQQRATLGALGTELSRLLTDPSVAAFLDPNRIKRSIDEINSLGTFQGQFAQQIFGGVGRTVADNQREKLLREAQANAKRVERIREILDSWFKNPPFGQLGFQ